MKIAAVDVTCGPQPSAGGRAILVIDAATNEGVAAGPGAGLTLDAESAAQHRVA